MAYKIAEINRLLRCRFDALAQEIGLPRPHWRVLLALADRQGSSQAALAAALAIEQITLTRHLDQLEAASLVERRRDPSDRRIRRLFLSPNAAPLLERMRALLARLDRDALEALDASDKAALHGLLEAIHARLVAQPNSESAPAPPGRFAAFLD